MDRKPLVVVAGRTKELPRSDDIDAPAVDRLDDLERRFMLLAHYLSEEGFDLPSDVFD